MSNSNKIFPDRHPFSIWLTPNAVTHSRYAPAFGQPSRCFAGTTRGRLGYAGRRSAGPFLFAEPEVALSTRCRYAPGELTP